MAVPPSLEALALAALEDLERLFEGLLELAESFLHLLVG